MNKMLLALILTLNVLTFEDSYATAKDKHVLIVLTGVDYITSADGKKHQTGYWLEEFTVPYLRFRKAGVKTTIATPNGNQPKADPSSAATDEKGKPLYWNSRKEYEEALELKRSVLDKGDIKSLKALIKQGKLTSFDAVFFPGGHAPMEDLADDPSVAQALRYFHKNKKPTALVCHGTIALLSTKTESGFPYKGYKVSAFSNSEEKGSAVGKHLKVTPETALRKAGAIYVKGEDWKSFIVEDRELITGQNPASSKAIADAVLKRLTSQ